MVRFTKNATANTDYALGVPWMALPMYLSNATLVQARAWACSEFLSRYVDTHLQKDSSALVITVTKFKNGKVQEFVGAVSDYDHVTDTACWTSYKTGESYRIGLFGAKINPKKSKKDVPILKRKLEL